MKKHKQVSLGLVDKLFIGVLLVIFGGIVLHAPLIVGFGSLFPDYELLIKSWKEILMLLAAVLAVIILTKKKRWSLLNNNLIFLIAGFAALHFVLIPNHFINLDSTIAGLMINLRYLFFFVLVYIAIGLYPEKRRLFLTVFLGGALVVLTFALLQATVLPPDVLKHLGYGQSTIMPYLTVDDNSDFIRINSTLRGPNSLGAYALIVMTLLVAFGLKGIHRFKRPMGVAILLATGGVVALWYSYSRSAVAATVVAIGLLVIVTIGRKLSKWVWALIVVVMIGLAVTTFVARDSYLVSNIVLHDNATTGAEATSNEGHADSLNDGTRRMVEQPLGGGIGSTGSASLLTDQPLIIENQYLFIAHEVGWLGLGLFLVILWKIMAGLWQRRADYLALGVFFGGIGIALIGLLLPVWTDDTVAIIWWGLAAIALAQTKSKVKI